MSKMSDLALTLDELRHCGEMLIGISESLREIFSGDEPDQEPQEQSVMESKESQVQTEAEKPVTFEELRALLARKTRVSKENTDAIREPLKKYGAGKLSEIKPEDYAALLKDAEVIPDA